MNPRLAKEFRAVLLPWCVALVTAIVIPLANFLIAAQVIEGGVFVSFILGLVVFAFFSSLLAIAASPFGTEFQHRTLPLLLSQPIPRSVIWRQKLIASLVSVGTALLVLALAGIVAEKAATAATTPDTVTAVPITATVEPATESSVPGGMSREQAEMYQRRYGLRPGIQSTQLQNRSPRPAEDVMSVSEICLGAIALLLPTLGSVTFWTLLARSTLGGMVFTAFCQLLVFGILGSIAERLGIFNYQVGILGLSAQTAISALASISYGGVFFWLSWRKFSRLEVSQLSPDTLAGSKSLSVHGLRLDWLRCRPGSSSLNLMRKEIQLQKPLFIMAALLCVLWGFCYILLILQPSRVTFAEIVFSLTLGAYIPLAAVLAGCVPLSEEKNLGLTGWHLTFPISMRRHWAVKLAVGLATWILLGLALPYVLTRLGLVISRIRLLKDVDEEGWLMIGLVGSSFFLTSFWAMSLAKSAIRAVLGSLAILVILCGAIALAIWTAVSLLGPFFSVAAWPLLFVLVIIPLLAQSLRQFRDLQFSGVVVFRRSAILAALTFVIVLGYFLLMELLGLSVHRIT